MSGRRRRPFVTSQALIVLLDKPSVSPRWCHVIKDSKVGNEMKTKLRWGSTADGQRHLTPNKTAVRSKIVRADAKRGSWRKTWKAFFFFFFSSCWAVSFLQRHFGWFVVIMLLFPPLLWLQSLCGKCVFKVIISLSVSHRLITWHFPVKCASFIAS